MNAAEAYYKATGNSPLNQAGNDYMAARERQKIMDYYQDSANRNYAERKEAQRTNNDTNTQVGTKTHSDVAKDVTNYWNSNKDNMPYIKDVFVEQSFKDGGIATKYNEAGSSRIDIVITNNSNSNVYIADLKTGGRRNKYSVAQQNKNSDNFGGKGNPNNYTYIHQEVRPQ